MKGLRILYLRLCVLYKVWYSYQKPIENGWWSVLSYTFLQLKIHQVQNRSKVEKTHTIFAHFRVISNKTSLEKNKDIIKFVSENVILSSINVIAAFIFEIIQILYERTRLNVCYKFLMKVATDSLWRCYRFINQMQFHVDTQLKRNFRTYVFVCLCWCFTSQLTIFQSFWDVFLPPGLVGICVMWPRSFVKRIFTPPPIYGGFD